MSSNDYVNILKAVREIRTTTDPAEVAQLLTTHHWIGISASPMPEGGYLFSVGRVVDQSIVSQSRAGSGNSGS